MAIDLRHNEIIFDEVIGDIKRSHDRGGAGRDGKGHGDRGNSEQKKTDERQYIKNARQDSQQGGIRNAEENQYAESVGGAQDLGNDLPDHVVAHDAGNFLAGHRDFLALDFGQKGKQPFIDALAVGEKVDGDD